MRGRGSFPQGRDAEVMTAIESKRDRVEHLQSTISTNSMVETHIFISASASPPYIAVITEPDCCDSDEQMERTFQALQQATRDGLVQLVSVRVALRTPKSHATSLTSTATDLESDDKKCTSVEQRVRDLTCRLLRLSEQQPLAMQETASTSPVTRPRFWVVLSSDWVAMAMECRAHGVHVKESHRFRIPQIRQDHQRQVRPDSSFSSFPYWWIGTSAHSVESALHAWDNYQPDYFFVGTCYMTTSHPEKQTAADLEGPALPGQVAHALSQPLTPETQTAMPPPPVLAIGGIDLDNCHEPIGLGAQGIAMIRAVLQAADPSATVHDLHQRMSRARSGMDQNK